MKNLYPDIIRLRNEYMQRARDHRPLGGNTYKHDVQTARGWNRYLLKLRASGHANRT